MELRLIQAGEKGMPPLLALFRLLPRLLARYPESSGGLALLALFRLLPRLLARYPESSGGLDVRSLSFS